jgi:S1-C subfamily serine protease
MKAAAHNDPGAETQLGALYSLNQLVKKDPTASVKWTAEAAEQGAGAALYNVAIAFSEGSVLPRDPRQAFFWFTVALPRLGESPSLASQAVHGRDKAATQMTLDETRGLQIIAQTWVPTKGSLDGVRAQAGKTTVGQIPRDTGSGITLNAVGDVLTARHVIKDCKRVTVTAPGGTSTDAVVGATDEATDLAMLKPASVVGRPAALRADDTIRQGERVLAAGYPISMLLGPELNTTEGTVSSTTGWRANKNGVLFSAAVSPGNSGGPLIAADGAVIGVVEGQLDNLVLAAAAGIIAENVNFASNIQVVRQFLDKNGIAYEKAIPGHELNAVELSARARNFTLLVACEE